MSQHKSEPFRAAFDHTLHGLIVTLKEAQDYLGTGQDNAAIGTLATIEDQFADLQAALRLFKNTRRRA